MSHEEKPPWGRWMILDQGPGYKVKRIEILPGRRLSYQRHFKRREYWRIVQGIALVTLEGSLIDLTEWENIEIPEGAAHRIENVGDTPLIFIEIQRGQYLEEDDILRLEDDYGRVT